MMEQTAPTVALPLQRKSLDVFLCALLISLLLHAAASLIVLIPGRSMVQGHAPLFVDLAALPPAAPPATTAGADVPDPVEELLPQPQEQQPEPPSPAETLDRTVSETLREAAGKPEVVHRTAIGLGMTSGYFGSFAEGETLKPEIREYYFTLMRRINEVWWTRSGESPSLGGASFILVVDRHGKVLACDPLQGTGDPRSDHLLVETVKLAEPLPPLPAGYPDQVFNAPIRFIPPLNLMVPGFMRRSPPLHG